MKMKTNALISVIIPVYNEGNTISTIIKKVENAYIENVKKEIIIIDDKSIDNTRNILRNIKRNKKYKIIFHDINKGKGAAVKTGLQFATGDIVIIQDADLEYDPNDYSKIIKPILERRCKVVYGSRFLNKKYSLFQNREIKMLFHFFGNIFLTTVTNILYGVKLTDIETCYKAFDTKFIKNLKFSANRFDIDPELTIKTIKSGQKILEVPINYSSRSFGAGKKITWRDGVKIFWFLIKNRFW